MIVLIWRNLSCLSAGKKSTSSFMFSLSYCKDLANLLLWVLWAHLAMHTPYDSINLQTSLYTSFFRYFILKNPSIWLADSILAHNQRTRILPDVGLVVKYQSTISFHFRLFPGKTNNKIYKKIPNLKYRKTLFWDHFGHFSPNLGKNEFPWKKELHQFLNIPITYHHAKNQKKLMSYPGRH